MGKNDIEIGHASIEEFFYWIDERHQIWRGRRDGVKWPWTDDSILQEWAFTNVYRQLDKGTIALRSMLDSNRADSNLVVFNIWWYRLFNWHGLADYPGFCFNYHQLEERILKVVERGGRVFTNAHMTTGVRGEKKHLSYLRAAKDAWNWRRIVFQMCKGGKLEDVFGELIHRYMIGRFLGYEIVCDLRFAINFSWKDTRTWANIGPGASRGLKRLGMKKHLDSLRYLLHMSRALCKFTSFDCPWPFELREIEHSLCEFDKYQRVKTGTGQPRRKYRRATD